MSLFSLIEDCKKNSISAQRKVYNMYARRMYLICKRYLRNTENARDTVAIGFVKFFNSLADFKYINEGSTYGWLKKIMVNECLTLLRSKTPFTLVPVEELNEQETREEIISGISAREIMNIVTQLPAGYRTIFNLFAIEQLSHKEIAKLLNISLGTSYSQLNRAKALLRDLFNQIK